MGLFISLPLDSLDDDAQGGAQIARRHRWRDEWRTAKRACRATTAEGVGTCLLLAAIVGSGIMAERLAGGSAGLALLCNALATGAALLALILTFGPISGAHFNPAVSLASAFQAELAWRDVPGYISVQAVGGVLGASRGDVRAPVFALSRHARGLAPGLERVRRDLRPARSHPGCSRRRPGARPSLSGLHRRGLLVYCLHVVRESRGNGRASHDGHVHRIRPQTCQRSSERSRRAALATGCSGGSRFRV
jgi:hypothetical protein